MTQLMSSMANYQTGICPTMTNSAQPIYAVFSLDDLYEKMSYKVEEVGEYDFPFTISAFGEFAETVINSILMVGEIDCRTSAIWLATIYVGHENSDRFFEEIFNDIRIQLNHFNVPLYPVSGFTHRAQMTGDLVMHLHYEQVATPPHQYYTRDDLLLCIENGDYISDKLRQQYGV